MLLVVSGLLLVGVGLPLVRRRVAPNRWYGVRISSTLADERTWYAVNEQCGRDLMVVGAVVAILGLLAPILLPRWPSELRTLLVAVVLIAGLAATTMRAIRHPPRLPHD